MNIIFPYRKGADLQVKAQEIRFGNLIKHDSFITHYIVDDDPNNGWYGTASMMKHYFADQYDVRIFLFNQSVVSFRVMKNTRCTSISSMIGAV